MEISKIHNNIGFSAVHVKLNHYTLQDLNPHKARHFESIFIDRGLKFKRCATSVKGEKNGNTFGLELIVNPETGSSAVAYTSQNLKKEKSFNKFMNKLLAPLTKIGILANSNWVGHIENESNAELAKRKLFTDVIFEAST